LNLTSLDQIWLSPNFPMWLTLAAAGFFAVILLIILLRAERSIANVALAVITLLGIGLAAVSTVRSFGTGERTASLEIPSSSLTSSLPALACIDDMAGETALAACEKALFGSPDSAAAAVAYASALISHLTAKGDVAANNNMTPEFQALRRAVERDRYGLMAYVLSVRDRCQPADCTAYRSLTDHNQIAANMEERIYESTISRYAPLWGAPAPAVAPSVSALLPTMPSGKPTTADFPTAASIPPVNIMTPEPTLSSAPSRPPPPANVPLASPHTAPAPATPAARTAAKKQAAPKSRAAAPAPVQLAPGPAVQLAPAPAEAE
jgi:hypothetical protein